jgi:hypothetical protein
MYRLFSTLLIALHISGAYGTVQYLGPYCSGQTDTKSVCPAKRLKGGV